MHNIPDLLFIKDFFTELQRKNIPYCILRNVNEVMQGNAHDVDMTVAANRLDDAEKALKKTAHKLNWKLHLQTGNSRDKYNYKSYNYHKLNEQEKKVQAQEVAHKLENLTLRFHVKSGKEGRVFGSVSTKQIVEELRKQGINVDKRKILDTSPVSSLGVTKVRVELYKDVIGTINVHLLEK